MWGSATHVNFDAKYGTRNSTIWLASSENDTLKSHQIIPFLLAGPK